MSNKSGLNWDLTAEQGFNLLRYIYEIPKDDTLQNLKSNFSRQKRIRFIFDHELTTEDVTKLSGVEQGRVVKAENSVCEYEVDKEKTSEVISQALKLGSVADIEIDSKPLKEIIEGMIR